MRKSTIAAIGLAAALALGDVAQATDYCFTTGSTVIAVPAFKVPKPGKCSTFKKGAYYYADGSPVLGTACTTTDGSAMRVSYQYLQYNNGSNISYSGHFDFPYPALGTGTYSELSWQEGNTIDAASGSANAAPCATPVPIN